MNTFILSLLNLSSSAEAEMYPADFKPAKKLKINPPTKIHRKSAKSMEIVITDDSSPDEDFNVISGVPNLLKKVKKNSPRTSTPSKDVTETPKSPDVESATPVESPNPTAGPTTPTVPVTPAVPTTPAAPVQPSTPVVPAASQETVEEAPKVPAPPAAESAVPTPDGNKSPVSNALEDVTPVTTPAQDQVTSGPSSDTGIVSLLLFLIVFSLYIFAIPCDSLIFLKIKIMLFQVFQFLINYHSFESSNYNHFRF